MKILPDDFALQMLQQINDLVSQLFGAILNVVGESIVTSAAGLWDAITANEWSGVLTFAFVLITSIIYGYRLVKNNLLDSIEYLSSKL